MPNSVPDDSIKKFYRCYRHGRIPVITWRHPHSKALLLRGAGYYSKGVMGMLKSHQSASGKCQQIVTLHSTMLHVCDINWK